MEVVKISDFRQNIKSITDSVTTNNKPVLIAGPNNKNLVLLSLENYNHLNTKYMENKDQINWYTDYVVNETINEEVGSILGTYSRLQTKNPNHSDIDKWKSEEKNWIDFESKLPTLVLKTKEQADDLISKIGSTSKALLALETKLDSKLSIKSA